MKPTEIILSLIVVVLTAVIVLGLLELRKEDQLKQSVIDGLKRQNEADEKRFKNAVDSITKIQVMQADSTKYYRLLKTKDQQTVKTKTESHEKIVFHNLNDSARHSKLAKFYPSYIRP